MSVNLIVDGTTYENATAITVGGKTIGIDEVSGGGGVASGSFTPDENKLTLSWDLGDEYNNLILWKDTTALTYGVKTVTLYVITGDIRYLGTTNTAGTVQTGSYDASANKYLNINGSTATFSSGAATGGYLVTEKYNWVAW